MKKQLKVKRRNEASSGLSPVFSKSGIGEVVDEVLRENEYIRNEVVSNPQYRDLLEEKTKEVIKKYKGVLYWAKIIDKWDRVTSGIGLTLEAIPGIGTAASLVEEVGETIPKAIYALYYKKKTGDKAALYKWGTAEAASFIPYVGDLIDWSNIYINRARKKTKELVTKEFLDLLSKNRGKNLEKRVAA
jgi:hypothetical protein